MSHNSGSLFVGDSMISRPKEFRKQCLPSSFRASGLFPELPCSDPYEGTVPAQKAKLPEIPTYASKRPLPAQDGMQELINVVQSTISESMERAMKPFFDEVIQHLRGSTHQGIVPLKHCNLSAGLHRMPADTSEVVLETAEQGPGTYQQRKVHADSMPSVLDQHRQPRDQQRFVLSGIYEDDECEKVTTRVRLSSEDSSTKSVRSRRSRTDTGFSTLAPVPAVVSLPKKTFVVNFHRLITMLKAFSVIHEIINSTVLASFTLVRVGSMTQLMISIVFMAYSMIIYTVHTLKSDILDISDYRSMVDLLWDDEDTCNGLAVNNPNRLIKALSYSRAGRRDACSYIISGLGASLFISLWFVFSIGRGADDDDTLGMEADDRELLMTLLLIGSVLLVFHLVYEWLFWRETQCCMPPCPDDPSLPWDPRKLGVPGSLHWFGLPSMWFSSREGYTELCQLYARARGLKPGETVFKLYPQELALYALDQECSQSLTAALRHAKHYDAIESKFLCYDDTGNCMPVADGQQPQQLGMELVFFDCLQHVYNQSDPGVFLQPDEFYKSTQMRRAFSEQLISA